MIRRTSQLALLLICPVVEVLNSHPLIASLPFDGHGLTAEYFTSDDLDPALLAVTRIDPTVNFDWGIGSPDLALPSGDRFSARWSGRLTARFDEPHTFFLQTGADEGARLWIDNTILIDTWYSPSATEQSATLKLVAGRAYNFKLEYKEGLGSARLIVRWFNANSLKEVLPGEQLQPNRPSEVTGTLLWEYWTEILGSRINDLTATAAFQANLPSATVVDQLDVPPGSEPGMGDKYGQRIRGYLIAPESGHYTFYVAGNNDTRLRLSNDATPDNARTIAESQGTTGYGEFDKSTSQRSSPVYLVAAERYYLEVLHTRGSGEDHLSVAWTRPGQLVDQRTIVSPDYLDIFRPRVMIHAERSSLTEEADSQPARFAVSRSDDLGRGLDVAYTVGGTATGGEDYELLSGLVTIPAGQKTAFIEVWPLEDNTADGKETVIVRLTPSADQRYWLGSESTLIATAMFGEDASAGQDLLPPDPLLLSNIPEFQGWGTHATFENFTLSDPDLPFSDALRINVHTVPANHWGVRPIWHIDHHAVNTGDNLLITMYLRSGQQGQTAEVALHFRRGNASTTRMNRRYTVGDEWELITMPFKARPDDAAKITRFDIRVGWALQTVEIGGLRILNSEASAPPSVLTSYAGREVDAPWRAAAEQRIEQIRKDLLEIVVRDEQGNPIEGAVVDARLQRHAFGFGNKVHAEFISPTYGSRYNTDDGRRYRALIPQLFNEALDNQVNWRPWLNQPDRAIEVLEYLNGLRLPFRGHNIIWGKMEGYPAPDWLNSTYQNIQNGQGAAAARDWLAQTVLDHIANDAPGSLAGTIAGTTLPQVAEWSVVNHPVWSSEVWDILGQDFMVDVLQHTRAVVHPDTRLYLNEDAILTGRSHVDPDEFFQLVTMLVSVGAPLDGLGLQSHFGSWDLPRIDEILAQMDRFAGFGLDLKSTEFDVDNTATDDQTQADFTRDFITLALSHPRMVGVMSFGIWEGRHWRADEGAHLFRQDWSVKPNGQTWLDLVGREFTTHVRGTTWADGRYTSRGFLGRYEVVISARRQTVILTPELLPGGTTVEATIFD